MKCTGCGGRGEYQLLGPVTKCDECDGTGEVVAQFKAAKLFPSESVHGRLPKGGMANHMVCATTAPQSNAVLFTNLYGDMNALFVEQDKVKEFLDKRPKLYVTLFNNVSNLPRTIDSLQDKMRTLKMPTSRILLYEYAVPYREFDMQDIELKYVPNGYGDFSVRPVNAGPYEFCKNGTFDVSHYAICEQIMPWKHDADPVFYIGALGNKGTGPASGCFQLSFGDLFSVS